MSIHVDKLIASLTPHERQNDAASLRLNSHEMITSGDAHDIFDALPYLNVIFVYFPGLRRENLNVCFQRCFLQCKPLT